MNKLNFVLNNELISANDINVLGYASNIVFAILNKLSVPVCCHFYQTASYESLH